MKHLRWQIIYSTLLASFFLLLLFRFETGLVRAEERKHVVQPGETLSVIAEKYDISMAQLMEINGISDPNALRVGQELTLRPDKIEPHEWLMSLRDWTLRFRYRLTLVLYVLPVEKPN